MRMMYGLRSGLVFEQRGQRGVIKELGHGLVDHLQNAAFASMLEIVSEVVNPASRNPFRREFPWCQAER